ncbi:hypothetical protein GEMRC1_003030 [Eukaryota sp. GEM-RC1]
MAARINKEIVRLLRDKIDGISVTVDPSNNRYLICQISGPPDSPYESGIFTVELYLPPSYPMEAPKCRFVTPIYHMNIDHVGRICLDILKDLWSPAMQINTVLLSIQSLLQEPNPNDPLDEKLGTQYLTDKAGYLRKAKQETQKHATPKC